MAEEKKTVVSVEILHLDELGYGPEGKYTRREWRKECLKNLLAGKEQFLEWQKSWIDLAKSNNCKATFSIEQIFSDGTKKVLYGLKVNSSALDFSGQVFTATLNCCSFEYLLDVFFLGATFSGAAYFGKAIFSAYVDFSRASILAKSDFEETLFAGNANFSEVGFLDKVGFNQSIFSGYANFSDAEFLGGVDFNKIHFSSDAYFHKTRFSAYVNFNASIFLGLADFSKAKMSNVANFGSIRFSGRTNFSDTCFLSYANFSCIQFLDYVNFSKTSFSGKASFSETIVSEEVSFSGGIFSSYADFSKTSFLGEVYFRDTTFLGYADFCETNFSGHTYFSEMSFSGVANFREARFSGAANFGDTSFLRNAYFLRSIFSGDASFIKSKFNSGSDFDSAVFEGSVNFENAVLDNVGHFSRATFLGKKSKIPAFRGCKIDRTHLEFSDEKNFTQADFSEDAIKNISFLKRLSDQHGQVDQALEFNAMELRAKRHNLLDGMQGWHWFKKVRSNQWWVTVFTLIYEKLSNFGRSFTDPLKYYAGVVFVTWLIAISVAVFHSPPLCQSEVKMRLLSDLARTNRCESTVDLPLTAFRAATEYTLYRASGLFSFTDKGKQLQEVNKRLFGAPIEPWWMRAFGLVVSLFSTILFFLTALGLRNRYRIK